jgi:hypothetical protein
MRDFRFHDIKQNTDEWYGLRAGRVTSSKLSVVMAGNVSYSVKMISEGVYAVVNDKLNAVLKPRYDDELEAEFVIAEKLSASTAPVFTPAAEAYAVNVAVEILTGKPVRSTYKNEDMERGHIEEPIAIEMYQNETFNEVSNGGIYTSGREGCSPDGRVVGDNGIIELKSAIPTIHRSRVKSGTFDHHYFWQFVGNMKFPKADWIDFVSYCGEYPEGKKLYIYRLLASEYVKEFAMIDERLALFHAMVDEIVIEINTGNYINLRLAA